MSRKHSCLPRALSSPGPAPVAQAQVVVPRLVCNLRKLWPQLAWAWGPAAGAARGKSPPQAPFFNLSTSLRQHFSPPFLAEHTQTDTFFNTLTQGTQSSARRSKEQLDTPRSQIRLQLTQPERSSFYQQLSKITLSLPVVISHICSTGSARVSCTW